MFRHSSGTAFTFYMKKVLAIHSSPGEQSITRALTYATLKTIKNKHSSFNIKERDLNADPVPHLSNDVVSAMLTPDDKKTDKMKNDLALSDQLTHELLDSDIIIIAAPMWNFSIPSALKAWMDHIIRAGLTFKFGENGIPHGLVSDKKKLIIISSRGGVYSEGPYKAYDHQEQLLQDLFNFIGIKDVEIIRSEGVRGDVQKALEICTPQIEKLTSNL